MVEVAPLSVLPPWRPASPPGPSHTALPRDAYRGTRWLAPYGPHIPHQWNHGFIGKYWILTRTQKVLARPAGKEMLKSH